MAAFGLPGLGKGIFGHEYEAELEQWLQRRFGWLCVVFATIELLHVAVAGASILLRHDEFAPATPKVWAGLASGVAGMAIASGFLLLHLRDRGGRRRLLRDAALMVLALGSLALLEFILVPLAPGERSVFLVPRFFLWHFLACLVLPWRPLESLRPMVPLMAVWAYLKIHHGWSVAPVDVTLQLLVAPLLVLPGLAVAAVRLRLHGARFRAELLGRQFLSMRRELRQARTVHESMFPTRYDDGFIRLDYCYAPALDVGGDFIHLHVSPTGVATVTIIDVTGHGIAAALTVSRLHGELERLRAEEPRIAPSAIVRALNRYVHLTLARHNVYATAICFEIDPHTSILRVCNAGHPPLLHHRRDGSVEPIDSTGMLLGALADEEYDCPEIEIAMEPGASVVAMTDGAFEAFDRHGRQLGIDALVDAIRGQAPRDGWPKRLVAMVDRHHGGRSQDDVLVATATMVASRAPRRAVAAVATEAST